MTYKDKVDELLEKHGFEEDTPENRQQLREALAKQRDASLIRETSNLITVEDNVRFNENVIKRINYALPSNPNALRDSNSKKPITTEEFLFLKSGAKELSVAVTLNGVEIVGQVGKNKQKSFLIDPEAISSETITIYDDKGRAIIKNKLAHEFETIKQMAMLDDDSVFIDPVTGEEKTNADIASEKLDALTNRIVIMLGDTPNKNDLFGTSKN